MTSWGSARILSGRYRLDERIGSGGAADVHRAFDLRLQRPVAVKIFRAGTGFDTEEGLSGEAVILARLQHPGLVTAFDAGRHDGNAYLVMQLIEGPTLRTRIAQGPLPRVTTIALGAGLAEALAHAHGAGVVHRDVKPSNIILDGSERPHLSDFGISRMLDATTATATGTLTGTAAYLSPEQVLGRPVGPPADVYALGLVLLECLTGRLEYDGGPLEAAIARLHRPPALPDALSVPLASLLRQMTDLEEHARPTAHDCARALTLLATHAMPESPASLSDRAIAGPAAAANGTTVTHKNLVPGAELAAVAAAPAVHARQGSRATPARSRLWTSGAAAALAAAAAATLAASDGPSHHTTTGKPTQSANSPAAPSERTHTAPTDDDGSLAAPTTPPSPPHSIPAGPHHDSAPRPSTPGDSSRVRDTDVTEASRAATAGVSGQSTPAASGLGKAKSPDKPPGQERKAGEKTR
ncbi:serine/threonine-protein kinase [Streptomyces galilaeus]|uniref:serine/threonine-protein kinase n=2 Tax=Streptomyces TaxID=1883 RepID=UPI001E3D2347|nr:serine/threonine-protein kinase [Streptomyces galilaeus]